MIAEHKTTVDEQELLDGLEYGDEQEDAQDFARDQGVVLPTQWSTSQDYPAAYE